MNALIVCAVVLLHPYWETSNYESNIVARLVTNDQRRIEHWQATIDRVGTNPWLEERLIPRYTWDMTNRVHWTRAHTTTNAPSFKFTGYAHRGRIHLEWCESLGDEWNRVASPQGQLRGTNVFRVYMHPDSDLTKRMLQSEHGFFRLKTEWDTKMLSIDMRGFFPANTNASTNVTGGTSGPPPSP